MAPVGSTTTFMHVKEEANSESDDYEDDEESVVQRVSVQDEGEAMFDYEQ